MVLDQIKFSYFSKTDKTFRRKAPHIEKASNFFEAFQAMFMEL